MPRAQRPLPPCGSPGHDEGWWDDKPGEFWVCAHCNTITDMTVPFPWKKHRSSKGRAA